MRSFEPSAVYGTHLPPIVGVPDSQWDTLVEAPDWPAFVGPDQAALEEMLAGFAPA